MNDSYRDLADLVARERLRKRTSLLAAAAAVVVTIVWICVIETLAAKARTQGHLAEAYYWGYSVPPFLLSWLVAVVVSAFPGRSWRRFCLVYTVVGIFTLAGPAKALFDFSDRARQANERASADAETERLMKEQARLTQELSDQPPFGPAGLASEEALAITENRLGALLEILAKAEDIEGKERTTPPAATPDAGLRELTRDNRREQAEAYRETRAALAILRTSWGRWTVVEQRVKFEAAQDEAQFRTLYEKAASAEQRATALRTRISQRFAK
jgi:hypothetical protein